MLLYRALSDSEAQLIYSIKFLFIASRVINDAISYFINEYFDILRVKDIFIQIKCFGIDFFYLNMSGLAIKSQSIGRLLTCAMVYIQYEILRTRTYGELRTFLYISYSF